MKIKGFKLSDKKPKMVDPDIGQVNPEKLHEVEEISYNAQYDSQSATLDYIYQTQSQLINKYRSLDESHYVSDAIDDIVDEAIVLDDKGFVQDVRLDIDDTEFSDGIKKKITDEWKYFTSFVYNIKDRLEEDFRNWYVDGQSSCYLIKAKDGLGLSEMRKVDSTYLNKIVKKTKKGNKTVSLKEIWVYDITKRLQNLSDKGLTDRINQMHYQTATVFDSAQLSMNGRIEIELDSIAHSNSGIRDENGFIKSLLHRAIKPFNDLTNFENSILIYTIARAPQRRIFYVDVGINKGKKAEAYVKDLIKQHRNKMVYDENSGQLNDAYNIRSMLEDYWLPRQAGSRGTDVQTLDGGGQLSDTDTITYYQNILYKALKSPMSRRVEDPALLSLGKPTETSRDEIKRSKFIKKLTNRFSKMILQGFITHIILKKIITNEEALESKGLFNIVFANDNQLTEAKNSEILLSKIEQLDAIKDHIGTFFTPDDVMRDVLNLTDEEIKEKNKQLEEYRKTQPKEDEDEF